VIRPGTVRRLSLIERLARGGPRPVVSVVAPAGYGKTTLLKCRAALSVLADHVPGGSRLAFAGQAQPSLRVARLRAEGKVTEIGPDDLSLTRYEA
jgi:ATP/maltotriose-dependent transcriptional regulator MalT